MARFKRYTEEDVLSAAVRRLTHIYETFDSVVTCFSGGKDSLVVLHLHRLVAARFGITRIPVIFRDEELIPDSVIAFVDGYRQQPWVDMRWYAVPLRSSRMVMGETIPYVQWDAARADGRWVRERPPWAITLPPGDARTFSQYDMDEFSAREFPGKVCFLTGIRAAESILRFRAVVNKLSQPHICASSCPRVMLGRPIYDWEEADVFKFFQDQGIDYCAVYDAQLMAGQKLRVSTPIHSESAKVLHTLARSDPEFLDRVMRVFPGTDVQTRYWREYDRAGIMAEYADEGLDGVERWIDETLSADIKPKALKVLATIRTLAIRRPEAYPPDHVLRGFIAGDWKRGMVQPLSATGVIEHQKRQVRRAAK